MAMVNVVASFHTNAAAPINQALSHGPLVAVFASPPASARSWVYWFTPNGNMAKKTGKPMLVFVGRKWPRHNPDNSRINLKLVQRDNDMPSLEEGKKTHAQVSIPHRNFRGGYGNALVYQQGIPV